MLALRGAVAMLDRALHARRRALIVCGSRKTAMRIILLRARANCGLTSGSNRSAHAAAPVVGGRLARMTFAASEQADDVWKRENPHQLVPICAMSGIALKRQRMG